MRRLTDQHVEVVMLIGTVMMALGNYGRRWFLSVLGLGLMLIAARWRLRSMEADERDARVRALLVFGTIFMLGMVVFVLLILTTK